MNDTEPSPFKMRQKVEYTGDMANESGSGAIVNATEYAVEIILDDGRTITHQINSLRHISERQGCAHRILLLDEIATAEEIITLQAAKVSRETLKQAEKEAKNAAYTAQIERLKAEYPKLLRGNEKNAVSKNIRTMLKDAFPGTKFSIRKESYTSVCISWNDGPTATAVEKLANRFVQGDFNGMEDIYEYTHTPFSDLFGSVKYIFTRRECSDEAIEVAIDMLTVEYNADRPTVGDFHSGLLLTKSPFENSSHHYSWNNLIHQKLAELSFPIDFASFVAIEVSPVVEYPEADANGQRICEAIGSDLVKAMDEKPDHHVFYSVYGRLPSGEAEAIADFEWHKYAKKYAEIVKGKHPNITDIIVK